MVYSIHLIRSFCVGLAIFASTCLGCGEVAPTNPFDPETPVAQQAKASVTGDVRLPEGEADPSVFERGRVGLFVQDKTASSRIQDCLSEDLTWIANEALVTDGLISSGDDAAVFSMANVPGGVYDLVLCVQGYVPLVVSGLFVERGVDKALSLRLTEPKVEASDAFMTGRVTLEGAPQDGHGQVLVSTIGRPYSAITAENGQFIMALPPGAYDISVSRDGFAREVFSDLMVSPNETLTVDDIFLIKDTSGRVRGQLSTTIASYEWSGTTEVRLIGDGIARTAIPSASGVFEFEQLTPGLYGLEIVSRGHLNISRVIEVVSGELDLEVIALEPESTTESAVYLRGKVFLQDQERDGPYHRGILIHVLRDNQLVASTLSDRNGEFALVASRLNYTLRFEKPGYQSRNEAVSWVEDNNRFELNAAALSEFEGIRLQRIPINGVLSVPVVVLPSWIPVEQRYVSLAITQLDGDFSRVIESVTDGEVVVLSELPAGTFEVSLSRPGFTTVTTPPIVLTTLNQASMLEPLVARLTRLADTNLDLDNQRLNACDLRTVRVNYQGGDFSGAILSGNFGNEGVNSTCRHCANGNPEGNECGSLNFTGANFINAFFDDRSISLSGAIFARANLFGARLDNVNASEADFRFANLFGVSAQGAQFAGANLSHANFTSASLQGARFAFSAGVHQAEMDLTRSVVRIAEPVPHPWAGLSKPMRPLPTAPCDVDESTTNLGRTNFAQANLSNAVMFGVDLSEAVLADALIIGGDLRHVCLANSSLNLTDLSNAVLDGADLSSARLINSILYRVKARGTNFRDANLTSAVIELAQFMPKGALEDDGVVDDSCASPPPWSEYYAEEGVQTNRVRDCNDRIDNDGDGLIDADDLGCLFGRNPSEASPGCVGDVANSAECRCRTRFDGANFNGANLIGTRFDGTDLTRATMLGAITGKSQEFPIKPSIACEQRTVEHCVDFCLVGGTTVFETNGNVCSGELDPDNPTVNCFGIYGANCRAKSSDFGFGVDMISCLYGQLTNRELLCPEYSEIDGGIYMPCAIEEMFGSLDGAPQEIRERLPPIYEPPPLKCTQELLEATWQMNQRGDLCNDHVDLSDPSETWGCCPEVYIDDDCVAAVTSFLDARLKGTEFTAGNLSGTEFVRAELSNAELSGATLINSTLNDANLSNVTARSSRMVNANLSGADLSGSRITQSELNRVDLSGTNLSETSFSGTVLTDPNLARIFVDVDAVPTDFTNAELNFRSLAAAQQKMTLSGLFRNTTINGLKAPAANITNSEFANSTLNDIEFYIGLDAGEFIAPMVTETWFRDTRMSGFSVTGLENARGLLRNVKFDEVNITPSQRTAGRSSNGFAFLDVEAFTLSDATLTGFDFSDLVVEGLILDSVDWTGGQWRDVSIDSAAMVNLQGNVSVLGDVQIARSSLFQVYALTVQGAGNLFALTDSRINRTELSSSGSSSAKTLQLSDLEIHSLTITGSVSDLQADKLNLKYREPVEQEFTVDCEELAVGGLCDDSQRCLYGNCYTMCSTDEDCPQDTMCDLTMCRPIGAEVPGLLDLIGDVTNSRFDTISGDRLAFGQGRLDADFSNLELRQLSLNGIVNFALSDGITLTKARLETLFIQNSNVQSLIINDVDVSSETRLSESTFDALEVTMRPSRRSGRVCGSRLRIFVSGGMGANVTLDDADLRGVCDLPTDWQDTSLDGTVMCQADLDAAVNFTGTPIGVACEQVLCPQHIYCQ